MSRMAAIERRCANQHIRMTEQRRVVIRLIAEATNHPDVEELHRRAHALDPNMSLSTVYRNLNLLEKLGLVKRHEFADGRSRYEVVPARHHDHLIDVETGQVTEFQSPEIEQLQIAIARQHGYQIVDHRLEIYVAPIGRSKNPHRKG